MRWILGGLGVIFLSGQLPAQAPSLLSSPRSPADTVDLPAGPAAGAAAVDTVTLRHAIQSALSRHPKLAAAEAEVDRAISEIRAARSANRPQLSTDASFMRFAEPMVTAPLHGFNPQQPPIFDRTLMQGGISLAYTLFDGGAGGARRARAEALVEAGEAGFTGARSELLRDVVQAYLRVSTAAELVAANAERVAALEGERDRAAQLLERGSAARVVVLRAEAGLGAARAEWYAARGEYEVALGDLARLTGLGQTRLASALLVPVRLAGGAAVQSDPARSGPAQSDPARALPDREALLERALASNPEIARLERLVGVADATLAEARALWFPSVAAVGRYTEYASGLGREQGEWQGGVQLSLPLFTGGTRRAFGDRAAAEYRSSRAALEVARLTVASALDRALAAVETEHARAAALGAAHERAAEVARIERLALDAGAGVQTDYLTAEAELLQVRAAWSAARVAEIGAYVELARIVGELSLEWLERNLESGS